MKQYCKIVAKDREVASFDLDHPAGMAVFMLALASAIKITCTTVKFVNKVTRKIIKGVTGNE